MLNLFQHLIRINQTLNQAQGEKRGFVRRSLRKGGNGGFYNV